VLNQISEYQSIIVVPYFLLRVPLLWNAVIEKKKVVKGAGLNFKFGVESAFSTQTMEHVLLLLTHRLLVLNT
jgi:hypothetical protein